jgi:hypothetical protein
MSRLIILTGAPETTNLNWGESHLINNDLLTKVASTGTSLPGLSIPGAPHAQWRQLPKARDGVQEVHKSADTQIEQIEDAGRAQFFTPQDLVSQVQLGNRSFGDEPPGSIASTETASEALSQFYDHSLAVHKDIPPTLLSELDSEPASAGRSSFDSDAGTPTSPSSAIRTPLQWPTLPVPQTQHLSDLEDIPSATYLCSIEPQTVTVNIIVGVLSIAPPRCVTTGARWGRERQSELVELLVGDDTKTGFSITMWLPPDLHVTWKDGATDMPDGSRSALRRSLRLLRPRDIVLIRNVALSSFRGKVHGQSLRNDITKVDLLFRKKQDRDDVGGSYTVQAVNSAGENDPQLMKVKKVRDWMVSFVPEPVTEVTSSGSRRRGRRRLPPDTP